MQDDLNICPNCGATMSQHSFTYECEFCDTIVLKDDLSEVYYKEDSESSIEDKYNYLKKNFSYVSQCKYLSCIKNGNCYEIKTVTSYYTNDGKYNKINDFCLSLSYDNDHETEHLYLRVNTNKFSPPPQLSIIIDQEFFVRPVFEKTDGDSIYFNIMRKELQIMCEAHLIQVASNCFDTEKAMFNELPSYCSRFYHFTFDKRKYIYSLHQHLITDK